MGVRVVVLDENPMQGRQVKGFTGIGGHQVKSVHAAAQICQGRLERLDFGNQWFYRGSLDFFGLSIFQDIDNPVKLGNDDGQHRKPGHDDNGAGNGHSPTVMGIDCFESVQEIPPWYVPLLLVTTGFPVRSLIWGG